MNSQIMISDVILNKFKIWLASSNNLFKMYNTRSMRYFSILRSDQNTYSSGNMFIINSWDKSQIKF